MHLTYGLLNHTNCGLYK